MDLGLTIEARSPSALLATYTCPCGCHPEVSYERGARPASDTCCCGNEFTVGVGADDQLTPRSGFNRHVERFETPWGDALPAVWAIGPSTHASEPGHEHGEHHESSAGTPSSSEPTDAAIDPVCGMMVEPVAARAKGLYSVYRWRDHFFCGKGCKLEFDEQPEQYLDPSYVPSM